MDNYFNDLYAVNVNGHTEKKNGLTYLSWAWAWGEIKKRHPDATYTVYENAEGWKHGRAYCYHPERAPAVCREHGTPDFPQILKKRLELVLRELAEGVQLGLGDKAREEH